MKPTIEQLSDALRQSWAAETAFNTDDWSAANPARGHCVVSSLIVQDYLGGELVGYRITAKDILESHYCNTLNNGTLIDTTASQYQQPVQQVRKPAKLDGFDSVRERLLSDANTKQRYLKLKVAVKRRIESPR